MSLDSTFSICFVRVKGLEPPRLAASDPKSDVSAISPHPLPFLNFKGLQK